MVFQRNLSDGKYKDEKNQENRWIRKPGSLLSPDKAVIITIAIKAQKKAQFAWETQSS